MPKVKKHSSEDVRKNQSLISNSNQSTRKYSLRHSQSQSAEDENHMHDEVNSKIYVIVIGNIIAIVH